jgi:hypothetical protein
MAGGVLALTVVQLMLGVGAFLLRLDGGAGTTLALILRASHLTVAALLLGCSIAMGERLRRCARRGADGPVMAGEGRA